MFALMKPSNVATRSSTRGTSRGCTVVTRTSGAGGPAWGALREQLDANERTMSETAVHFAIVNNRGSAIGSFHSRDIIGKLYRTSGFKESGQCRVHLVGP